jgi:hypothetical protein
LIVLPAALRAQQTERYTLDAGPVAVYNLVGDLRVEPGTGAVVVQVTRSGSDAGQLRIAQGSIGGRSTLRVVYPGDRVRYGIGGGDNSTELRVRDDGTFGDDGDEDHGRGRHDRHGWEEGCRVTITSRAGGLDARADLLVQVPRGGRVALFLAVGSVTVSNVDGDLSIDSHSAPVTASGTKGRLSVDTGSGDVTGVDLVSDELSIDTGSGEIRLTGVALAPALPGNGQRRRHGRSAARHRVAPRRDRVGRHRDGFPAADHPARPGSHGGDDRGREGDDRDRDGVGREQAPEEVELIPRASA